MKPSALAKSVPIITFICFIVMVTVNGLANALPINGRTTGAISDNYANLFAPAGITFSIWGVIYSLLLIYTIYQLSYYRQVDEIKKQRFIKIGIIYSISSIANTLWILAWHYDWIWLTVILITTILICLLLINRYMKEQEISGAEKYLIKLPFEVYFGWITVAVIANVTTFLVQQNWNRFGLSETLWATLIILVGASIGASTTFYYKSLAYGAVLMWAYLGIGLKHLSPAGFNGMYTTVIIAVLVSLIVLIASEGLTLHAKLKKTS